MPVTVVVGGQYGSEGKGKVAQYLATQCGADAVVRVGGSNSGHTGYAPDGTLHVFRHLPTAALIEGTSCFIGAGSYIDPGVILEEIGRIELPASRLTIDEKAFVITSEDKDDESTAGLVDRIGSTGSGTGASVRRRVERASPPITVRDVPELAPYLGDVSQSLRDTLEAGGRVIVEGTQGFGLSLLHSPFYPYTTSRDTTAAGALAEAGLSPLDVDEVVLVLRTFPIRVGGRSGPLERETDWQSITEDSDAPVALEEFTSVTGRLRRVAEFEPEAVKRAIIANAPTLIVLNHIDYVDHRCAEEGLLTERARAFIAETAEAIRAEIGLVGIGPSMMVSLAPTFSRAIC
jgi:adenylosuccinate synthase